MAPSNDRKELERRLEQAKRTAALPVDPLTKERLQISAGVGRATAVVGVGVQGCAAFQVLSDGLSSGLGSVRDPGAGRFPKKVAGANGAYEHAGEWIIDAVAGVASLPGFYPVLLVLTGMLVGVWFDALFVGSTAAATLSWWTWVTTFVVWDVIFGKGRTFFVTHGR